MDGPQPRLPRVIPYCTKERRSCILKTTYVRNARIQGTRTLTRLTHVASAGIVLASHLRPLSPTARGVRRAGQRARASVAAHSSALCPHSSLRKHKRSARPRSRLRSQCLAAIPCRVPSRDLCLFPLFHMEVYPRQARLWSCRVIHVSEDDCAGGVVDVARPRS